MKLRKTGVISAMVIGALGALQSLEAVAGTCTCIQNWWDQQCPSSQLSFSSPSATECSGNNDRTARGDCSGQTWSFQLSSCQYSQ